ncbi:hypothetical protein [Nonomuraea insulae]|uniref:Uncharacterized protein n=1 Tax=Nonomuraea insulae TaxID=1616787 RepID=A0ABW1CR69_9ACTN
MTTPERDDDPAAGQDFGRVWSVLAHVVTPTTFIAALMIYFGALRANTSYSALGVHSSLLKFSFQDYALHSVSSLAEPLALTLLVILAALPAHALLVRFMTRHRAATKRAIVVLTALGTAGVLAGLIGAAGWWKPRTREPVVPMCLALGVFALGYAASLHARVYPRPRNTGWIIQRAVFVALLMLLLLWSLAVIAQTRGAEKAKEFQRKPFNLPGVVVYAPQRLHLEGPGITETTFPDEKAMYRYRYSGLSLLLHSDEKYFLLPACWWTTTTSPIQAITLPADSSLRLDFFSYTVLPTCPPGR